MSSCALVLSQVPVLPTLRFTHQIGLLWNHLPRVKKLLGGWPKIWLLFICLPIATLLSSNLSVSCQFRQLLSLFNVQEYSFHQFQGLRHPGEQSISIIHSTRKSAIQLVFRLIGWFWLFQGWKASKFGKLSVLKIGLLWSRLLWVKMPICRGLAF